MKKPRLLHAPRTHHFPFEETTQSLGEKVILFLKAQGKYEQNFPLFQEMSHKWWKMN